jgi:hypothetical protein
MKNCYILFSLCLLINSIYSFTKNVRSNIFNARDPAFLSNRSKFNEIFKKYHTKVISDFERRLANETAIPAQTQTTTTQPSIRKGSSMLINTNSVKGSCNNDILKTFGIEKTDQDSQPKQSDASTKLYCRLNRTTCCSAEDIISTNKNFTQASKELKKRFELLEEIAVLFQGEKYKEIIFEVSRNDKCNSIVEKNIYYQNNLEDFYENILPTLVNKVLELTVDTYEYVKENMWFYSNLICTICNPLSTDFFKFSPGNSTVVANTSNCSKHLDLAEFEIRAISIFENVIKLFVDLIKCHNDLNEDDDYKVDDLLTDKINEEKAEFYSCFESYDFSSQVCSNICNKRQLDDWNFPIPFFKSLGQSLKVLFPHMAGMEINEYYEKVKKANIEDYMKDEPIQFFAKNESFLKFNLDNIHWDLKSSEGITIYNDKMGKQYFLYKVKESAALLQTIVVAFMVLLF